MDDQKLDIVNWFDNWLSNRLHLMPKVHKIPASRVAYQLVNRVENTPEYYIPNTMYPNEANLKELPEDSIFRWIRPNGFASGAYYPNDFIPGYLPGTITYLDPNESTRIHENTHALEADFVENKIREYIDSHNIFRDSTTKDDYLDNEKEIYARLMQLRHKNNLDPTKKYQVKTKENGFQSTSADIGIKSTEDFDILNRYSNEFVDFLLNEVAQNNNYNSDAYYAKSGIKIKESNKGKFTEYCDGKVTQECIDKAKKSGNKKLIKRAVFAENARKWKHQNGGLIQKFQNPATPIKSWMSREDFLKAKANEEQEFAHQYSLNRTNPDVPMVPVDYTEDYFNETKNYWIDFYTNLINKTTNVSEREQYKAKLDEYVQRKYEHLVPGPSCAYTSTGNYSQRGINRRCSGNLIFASNPQKYGFVPITKDQLRPGDLVQTPTKGHMMTFDSYTENGTPLYNYSNGGSDQRSIKVKNKYPMNEDGYYYTFVGTPEDQRRWTGEWLNQYMPMDFKPQGLVYKNTNLKLPNKINYIKSKINEEKIN